MNPSPVSPESSGQAAADASQPAGGVAELQLDHLVTGGRWRSVYQVGDALPDVTYGRCLQAVHVGTMNDVILRSFRVNDGQRGEVWERIRRAQNGRMVECVECVEAEGRRIEVVQAPPTVTLREWGGSGKPGRAEITPVVRQLAEAVQALHQAGVAHLNIRPDSVFVRTTEAGAGVFLGGFECAVALGGADLAEAAVDPFYAPPEALGLYQHGRGPSLRAWDWWSVGRVLQELVLGRHVLGHLLGRDVSRPTPELRARAEKLLGEEDVSMRAGGVEAMPAMDKEVTTLLRGLLASSREGRWGHGEIERWLRGEPVKERYSHPKHEKFFVWKDRAYTVPEAAEFFAQEGNWGDGLANLFDAGDRRTLAHFLGESGALRKTKEKYDALVKLRDAPELQALPPETACDVLAALLLKFLAGGHVPLMLRGRKVDQACLRALLRPEAQPAGLATVNGFAAHAVSHQIEQMDAEAGWVFSELERIYEGAEAVALANGWLNKGDAVKTAQLMGFCLETETALGRSRAEMLKAYACSRDRALDKVFKKTDASVAELAVIAFTGTDPARHGYVTHREWNEEQHRLLRERGERLSAAAMWLNLGRCLQAGFLVFGRWWVFALFWLLAGGAASYVWQKIPAYGLALAVPGAALAARLVWCGLHRDVLKRRVPEAAPWTLRSGAGRCAREAAAALQAESVPGVGALMKSLREVNEDISKLTLEPPPVPVALPERWRSTLGLAVAAWAVVAVLAGGTVWQGVRHPPKPPKIEMTWLGRLLFSSEKKPEGAAVGEKPKLSASQAPSVGTKSIATKLEELRRAKREAAKESETVPKIQWPFKVPESGHEVRVREEAVALPEQTAVAEEMGALLLGGYEAGSIKGLLAVEVPTVSGVGLMLYDGRSGKLSGKTVYTIGFLPLPKSWIVLDGKKAIFLGGG